MPDELNLTLPKRETVPHRPPRVIFLCLVAVLVISAANLALLLSRGNGGRASSAAVSSDLPADQQKELALKLEREGLHGSAVRAWQTYLRQASVDDKQRANIWYRIGKIQQDAGRNEEALESFYTSESIAKLDDLSPEIARRNRECLEALGKFAALRGALAERVDLTKGKGAAGGEVVAEIGSEKITKGRLDQMIEEQIDRQLAQYAALMPPEERKRQKEAMVQRLGTAEARLQLLDQLIAEEVLYRKAREDKLAEDPDTRTLLGDLERKLLAQRVVEKELAVQVKITPTDVQTYYEAHAKEYKEPEKTQISHIQVKDEAAAQAVLKRLKGGEKFDALAKELSLDAATKDKGGDVPDWAEKGAPIPGIGASDEVTAAIFTTEAGKLVEKPVKSDQGFHVIKVRTREPERQRPFEEVKVEVYRALRGQKSRDVQQQLLAELRDRYNVIIHRAQFAPKEEAEPKGGAVPAPKATPPKAAPKGVQASPAK